MLIGQAKNILDIKRENQPRYYKGQPTSHALRKPYCYRHALLSLGAHALKSIGAHVRRGIVPMGTNPGSSTIAQLHTKQKQKVYKFQQIFGTAKSDTTGLLLQDSGA
jgi:hypothetical protein